MEKIIRTLKLLPDEEYLETEPEDEFTGTIEREEGEEIIENAPKGFGDSGGFTIIADLKD